MNVCIKSNSSHRNRRYLSQLSLAIILLFALGCGSISTEMDNYCTEQCSELFGRHVEGVWQGNDFYWVKTRCLCHNNDFGTEHMFDLVKVKD